MNQPLNQILERVRTFKMSFWAYHNIKFTPYELASIGYSAVGLNILQCAICHHQVKVNQETYGELQQQLFNHEQNCIYKDQSMQKVTKQELYLKMDQFHSLLKNSYAKQTNIEKNYKQLYPLINIQAFYDFVGPHKHTLYKILEKHKANDKQISIPFILQFMGWRLVSSKQDSSINNNLECFYCGRDININKFKTTQNQSQQREQSLELSKDKELFDPTSQHRYYCLWTGSVRGWELNLQHLWDKIGESQSFFKRENPAETQKVRVRFDGYLQNFQIRTRELFQKINGVMDDCKDLSKGLQGQSYKQLSQKCVKNKDLFDQFQNEVQENVRKPLKKIKLN